MAIDFDFLRHRHRLGLASNGSAGTSVALPRERLQRAERELSAARAAMRSAADAAGVERSGLFSDTTFVPRSTADSWHEAGFKEGKRAILDMMMEMRGLDPKVEWARREAESKAFAVTWKAETARWRSMMREAGFFAAVEAGDHRKAAAIFRAANSEIFDKPDKVTGAAIVAAARRARMSGDTERPLPPKGSLAAQIIAAGKKARRPTGSDE